MAEDLACGFAAVQAEAGDPGTIRRGSHTTTLDAIVVGMVEHQGRDAGGQTIIVSRKIDVLIPPQDYRIDSAETLPVMGDRITVGIAPRVRSFVVVADESKKCWRYSDGFRTFLRIHVDEV